MTRRLVSVAVAALAAISFALAVLFVEELDAALRAIGDS